MKSEDELTFIDVAFNPDHKDEVFAKRINNDVSSQMGVIGMELQALLESIGFRPSPVDTFSVRKVQVKSYIEKRLEEIKLEDEQDAKRSKQNKKTESTPIQLRHLKGES